MTGNKRYSLFPFFSPLDLATILYVLISGIYIGFSNSDFPMLMPHLVIRLSVVLFIIFLSVLSRTFHSASLLFLRNLYPLLLLGFFYTETNCMKNIVFHADLDVYFFKAEQYLWNCQPSLAFSKWMDQGWFNELMNLCYFSYYILIGLVCITLYLSDPSHSEKGIFIVVFSFYLYYIIFAVLPVVGPQYYVPEANVNAAPHFFGKLMRGILVAYEKPTGAFPSSHAGIAVVISYVAFMHLRKLFFIILPFAIGICFATVYIKAHYLVDVLAGIISAPLFIFLSGKIYNKFLSYAIHKKTERVK